MLTEVKIKQAKPEAKLYRLYDQGGLYLEVSPKGQKYWRYKFRINVGGARKEKRLAIGVYPEVSLKLGCWFWLPTRKRLRGRSMN